MIRQGLLGVDGTVRLAHYAITNTSRWTTFWGEDQSYGEEVEKLIASANNNSN